MKKVRLMLAALTLATIAGSFGTSTAADCDPFGGCENNTTNYGNASCGTGTTVVPNVGEVKADPAKGVYVCNDGGSDEVLSNNPAAKVEGRIFVYKDANNGVHVVVDGDDIDNTGGAKGWDRLDVNSGKAACFRRGSAGQAWNSNGSSDPADAPPNQQLGDPVCTPA
jgi:hypothetical protein